MGKLIRKDETIENAFGVLVDCCEIYIKDGVQPPQEAIQALLSVAWVHGGVPQHKISEMAAFLFSLPKQARGEQCLEIGSKKS